MWEPARCGDLSSIPQVDLMSDEANPVLGDHPTRQVFDTRDPARKTGPKATGTRGQVESWLMLKYEN